MWTLLAARAALLGAREKFTATEEVLELQGLPNDADHEVGDMRNTGKVIIPCAAHEARHHCHVVGGAADNVLSAAVVFAAEVVNELVVVGCSARLGAVFKLDQQQNRVRQRRRVGDDKRDFLSSAVLGGRCVNIQHKIVPLEAIGNVPLQVVNSAVLGAAFFSA